MKKYSFLPILALVLGIMASAFTTKESAHPQTEDLLYWYFVDANGNLDSQIGSGQDVKSNVMSTTGCEDQVTTECARGYSSPQSGFGFPAPDVQNQELHIIRKTEE